VSTVPARELEKSRALTLREATVGSDLVIENVGGAHCDRLRDLGFCESIQVRKLANGRNLVCSVCGTRLAISRELAEGIRVRLI
jgi:ferrous iron transport protein A